MYSEIDEIISRLPFTVDDNSIPSDSDVRGLQEQANMFINGWLGRNSDVSGNPGALKIIEITKTIDWALAWDEGRQPFLNFNRTEKMLLDNYRGDRMVYIGDLEIDA